VNIPATLKVTSVKGGNVDSTLDVSTFGFDPAEVVSAINAGETLINVVHDSFMPDGAPMAEVTEAGNVHILWTGLTAEHVATKRAEALEALKAGFACEPLEGGILEALTLLHDSGIELKWLVQASPEPVKAGRGVPSDFKWELGRTYENGDDRMTYAAPAQFVHADITFNSASAAARYCVAARDGNAGSDDSKYNRNGKTFWK
jgi:hypothetical protein